MEALSIALVVMEYSLGFYGISVLMRYGQILIVKIYLLLALSIQMKVLI